MRKKSNKQLNKLLDKWPKNKDLIKQISKEISK